MRELVTVGYFDSEIKAQLARLALEEAGIRVWAGSEPQPNWDGGVNLQVEREDEQAARKVLTDRSPVEYPEESEEVFDSRDARGETAELKEEPTLREQEAQRALTTAVLAWLLCPLQLVVVPLLLKVLFLRQRLAEPYRRKAWLAVAIHAPFLLIVLFVIWAIGSAPQREAVQPAAGDQMGEQILRSLMPPSKGRLGEGGQEDDGHGGATHLAPWCNPPGSGVFGRRGSDQLENVFRPKIPDP